MFDGDYEVEESHGGGKCACHCLFRLCDHICIYVFTLSTLLYPSILFSNYISYWNDYCSFLGFVRNYYSSENEEVETDGNEDKGAGYDFKKDYESEQGSHERTEVIDVDKFPFDEFEVEINGKGQSCNAFAEGDEVIDVDKFPFDEFEVEISEESRSRNAFREGCHESDEVIDVNNFPFDNFVVEMSDERGNICLCLVIFLHSAFLLICQR